MKMDCGLPIVVIFVAFCILVFCCAMTEYDRSNEPGQVLTVFTMDGCGPCHKLTDYMAARNIQTTVTVQTAQPVVPDGYPAVCYKLRSGNLVWDNGERIYEGRFWLTKQPVQRVHWQTK
jgi:hypothetical protein